MGRHPCPFPLTLTLLILIILSIYTIHKDPETLNSGQVFKRRKLIGPGSWPPSCRSKCGSCTPCKAVHVPIQPGVSVPLEYYPEAWRCKCGNHLYMP
ncbi:EPIDERMAL PATTERNING FACTOR-like protein 5 [Amaranthus tricolor]|uniref:EPIDERMAL PATTERNING FACTOR-like protein 5 n=1 Tax=Amaranthus tricolor TaxID=29722 RepID=UPI002591271F|nr:EPIDERMAL PATTERNING FACTOR-like protein 5 [Amaranthus tricolor]